MGKNWAVSGWSFLAKLKVFSMLADVSFRFPTMKQPWTIIPASWQRRTKRYASSWYFASRRSSLFFFLAREDSPVPTFEANTKKARTSFVKGGKQLAFRANIGAAVRIEG